MTSSQLLAHWQIEPAVLVWLAAAGGAYTFGVLRVRARGRAAWRWQPTLCFFGGLLALFVSLSSGLEHYGEQLLSVHMVAHLLLLFVAAPLLLAGRPVEFALRASRRDTRRALAAALRQPLWRVLSHPATGLAAITAVMIVWHLTGLYDLALRRPWLHALEHSSYLAAALCFWAVVVAPGPRPHPLSGLAKTVYLLAAMPAMSVVATVLETDGSPRYPTHALRTLARGGNPLADQQLGAAVMWVGGSLLLGAAAVLIGWQSMLAEERRAVRRETRGSLAA